MCKKFKFVFFVVLWVKIVGVVEIDVPVFGAQQPSDYVDPLIGTAGSGNVIPGPQLPHGRVKLSPDTISFPLGGYAYEDSRIVGFSHTHLQGTGGGAYGNVLIMPTIGDLAITEKLYASEFSHAEETASPEYYAVILEDYNIRAELTATEHAGFHRYVFPESEESHILIDVGHALGSCAKGYVKIIDNKIRGYGIYSTRRRAGATYPVYFYAEFSKPFNSFGTWNDEEVNPGSSEESGEDIGVFVNYSTLEKEEIKVKIGISSISMEQARQNLKKEIPDWDFNGIREKAKQIWNEVLSRIRVEGGTEEQKVKFYTALYHVLFEPTDYTEYGYYYSGFSGKGEVYPAEKHHFYTDDWCIWDTFRTTHPLQTIVEPERQSDMAQSYVCIYEQGGWMPKCPWCATGYYRCMIGNHATSVIADIYMKGFRNFDIEKAYEGMKKSAMKWGGDLGTPRDYIDLGYVWFSRDGRFRERDSVSITLEDAYDDWCLAQVAKALGHKEDYEIFIKRSANYKNHFDASTGFMRPRLRDGSWLEPFNPRSGDGFCESSSWQQTWFVPHDVQGLIELMGGRENFVNKLDTYFEKKYHRQGNEPSFINPFLFDYAGALWKTQEQVTEIMATDYGTGPSGLCGNDDAGTMSAWYVFSAMGFYPVCPGQNVYAIGSPIFDKVTIRLSSPYYKGDEFVIIAEDVSEENKYIQSVSLNGKPLNKPWFHHSAIVNGGKLVFQMGPEPNENWGSLPEAAPPSMTKK